MRQRELARAKRTANWSLSVDQLPWHMHDLFPAASRSLTLNLTSSQKLSLCEISFPLADGAGVGKNTGNKPLSWKQIKPICFTVSLRPELHVTRARGQGHRSVTTAVNIRGLTG
ncbi:hypothetical protein Bbelb_044120 [Branchiostoma belcheri]|nr:hypothetical protein Bbelb_044120 [Branchiostoma belcheri]